MLAHRRSPFRCLFAALLAGCSSMPAPGYPPHEQHDFVADVAVGEDGRLHLPHSSRDLVIRRLQLDPAPQAERFDGDGERYFVFPPGSSVTIRGSLRVYADEGGAAPTLQQLLPGAALRERGAGDADRRP